MKARLRLGEHPVHRVGKFEPHNDPVVLTAKAEAAVKEHTDLVRRSREAGGHDDDAMKRGQCPCGYCGCK